MATPNEDDKTPARRKILTAARTLFTTTGYASTTIKAIAAEAGVAVQTVYFVFGNKRSVLAALLDVSIAGDDEPIATLDRPWVAEAVAEPDPMAQLRIQVHGARLILDRVGPVLLAVRAAAGADPEVAQLWATTCEHHETVLRHLTTALADKVDGLDVDRCVDVGLALQSPETHALLIDERGWSATDYDDWVVDALASAAGIAG
ncbi:TetR family transcriptional regulator [Rhodococcus sp. OK611]|uniref:TetR/AcrR family transcriptional regulator n=1 Tax=unclassified Rhodococcus (in: high G+C Gram-positive bacteria) TaxID=192944 RepID=UPI000BD712F9|nr:MULTISPECIES: TetR/AcrR family transcriptional regulator [unclassified Rhodococcus (in: high G+C Gram-positive bacteria)]PTR36705.1 TetR family transcriptional regulator [Rhodococcus sp. OK611]SNX93799.1 transcriptional regulator, TetR family [Rhodococcus sp. OK270]